MKLIDQFSWFHSWLICHEVSPNAILFWDTLLHLFNINYWPDKLMLRPELIKSHTHLGRNKTISAARKELCELGLITFDAETNEYQIKEFVKDEYGVHLANKETKTPKAETKQEKPKQDKKPKKKRSDPLPYAQIMEFWNTHHGNMPEIKKMTDTRKRCVQKLVKDGYTIADIEAVIKKAEASDFLNGRTKGSDWRADFSWLLKPEKFIKTLEGGYDNETGAQTEEPVVTFDDEDLYAAYR